MLAHAALHSAQTSCDPLPDSCSTLRDSVSPLTRFSSSAAVLVVSSITGSTRDQTSIPSFRHELPRSSQCACAPLEVANCQTEQPETCQRTIVFLLLPARKSMKFLQLYLLCFQSSAARPQAYARFLCKPASGLLHGDILSRIHAAFIRSRDDS